MGFQTVLVFHSPSGAQVPALLREFATQTGLVVEEVREASGVVDMVNRSLPAGIYIDMTRGDATLELIKRLKSDAFSAIVPVIVRVAPNDPELTFASFEAGADEVLTDALVERERLLRMHMAHQRAARDVSVHPTTRLPGTPQIDRDIAERIRRGAPFAVCYADLDHFKEFNDRYGYNEGDRVIKVLSRILRDLVRGHCGADGFVGHIGGDDFIFNLPLDKMRLVCEEIIQIFDELVPFQYTEEDRRAGYFLGRDRRGNILWVPLMTLSIGVVTNHQRNFEHTARVSELATEMKSFAKKLPGSVYAVDRRSDARGAYPGQAILSSEELEARKDT